jgi:hypothetical protein
VGPASGASRLRVTPVVRARRNGEKVAGRGDTVRLWSGERLRRVWRHWGERRWKFCFGRMDIEARNVANPMAGCGVQQTRRASMRSKPSKSGGTTRTERARSVATPCRRSSAFSEVVVREWTQDVFAGGGAIFQNLDSDVRIEFSDLSWVPRGSCEGPKAREGSTSWLCASAEWRRSRGRYSWSPPTTRCA